MKKKYLFLLPLLLMPLTACDLSNLNNKNDKDDEETSEPGAGEPLSFNKEQAVNKLKEYGQTTGFDIAVETKSVDDTGTTTSSFEVAMKNDMVWLISDGSYSGIKLNANSVTAFTSEDGTTYEKTEVGQDQLDGKTPEQFFDDYMESLTTWLYFAEYSSALGLKKVRDFTYVGRSASEYANKITYGPYVANYKAYIDNELDITLYFLAESSSPEEGNDTEEIKVTSFKSGDQVVKPNIQ